MSTDLLSAALQYASAGTPVFPCKHDKSPHITGGHKSASKDQNQIRLWWENWPDALIGMPTGAASGICVLDIDKKNGKDGFSSLANWEALSPVRVRTRSGGAHLYFRNSPNIKNSTGSDGIDVRGNGGYVIVPPSPGYVFVAGSDFTPDSLPAWPDLKRPTPKEDRCGSPGALKLLRAALMAIPNQERDWEAWNKVGMAVWRGTQGSDAGFDMFDLWSQQAPIYSAATTKDRWNHYSKSPPELVGAGTIYHLADVMKPSWRYGPDAAASLILPLYQHGEVPADTGGWLVRNRLQETGAGLLLGQWGTYKTFVALDLAVHVSYGWDWTGEPIFRRGGVVIFAGEGASGLPLRLAALVEHKIAKRLENDDVSYRINQNALPIKWTKSCPLLLDGESALASMAATAQSAHDSFMAAYDLPLALILVDTVAVCAGWTDENDNAEASRVMAILRELSQKTGALVIGIDHLGKNMEMGARGASAKEANSDFVLAILGDRELGGKVKDTRLALRKLRDGPQGKEIPFEARQVPMGIDEYGYDISSVVIDWNVVRPPRKNRLTPSRAAFDKALTDTLFAASKIMKTEFGDIAVVTRDELRDAFRAHYQTGIERKKTAKDQRFRENLDEARRDGRIVIIKAGEGEWIGRVPPPM